MDTVLFLVIIGVAVVAALSVFTPRQPPQILYVQTETQQSSSLGCLPMIVFGVIVVLLLNTLPK